MPIPAALRVSKPTGGDSLGYVSHGSAAGKHQRSRRHAALVAAVKRLLALYGCHSFKVGQVATPVHGKPGVFRRGSVDAGTADVLACGPRGRFIAVEVKIGRDVIRPKQVEFADEIKKRKGLHIVARDTVQTVIDARREIEED